MADNNSHNLNRSRRTDDYGDGYGGTPRDDSRSYDDRYGDYPVTSRYADYFEEFEDSEYEDISSHSRRNRRSGSHQTDRRHTSSKNSKSHKKKRKHTLAKTLCMLLVIGLVLAGGVCLLAYSMLSPINYVEIDTGDDATGEFSMQSGSGELLSDPYVLNIMLFGVDEDSSEFGRSDSMILLSIDNRHKKLKMTSFQRDTFVYVPDPEGSYHTKLTNAFSYGGVELAIRTIEANYGVQVDRYATVNFESFKSIVDILGGVELELTDREILYINCQIAQNNQTEYLDAVAGPVTLNGQQALWHARNRGGDVINGVEFYEGTDWDRTERQRKFLSAVIDDMRGASMTDILRIVNEVGPHITTNLKKTEIMTLVASSLTYLKYDVEQCSMPSEDTWSYVQNFAGDVIYVDDWDIARRDLAQFIYEDSVTSAGE